MSYDDEAIGRDPGDDGTAGLSALLDAAHARGMSVAEWRRQQAVRPRARRQPSVRDLRESAAFLLAQAALIEARPKEPVSGVAVFDKQFDNEREGSEPYRYAAVKAGGGWWLTGRGGPQGGCWEDVLDFIYDRSETVTFYAVEITQLP